MVARVSIDADSLAQLKLSGEVRVEDIHGIPLVLMTLDARKQLLRSDLTEVDALSERELRNQGSESLADPEGWGDPSMDVYDTMPAVGSDNHGDS